MTEDEFRNGPTNDNTPLSNDEQIAVEAEAPKPDAAAGVDAEQTSTTESPVVTSASEPVVDLGADVVAVGDDLVKLAEDAAQEMIQAAESVL